MITKWLKMGAMATVGLGLAGGLLFGKDIVSYARSSAKGVRTVVKDSVPIELNCVGPAICWKRSSRRCMPTSG